MLRGQAEFALILGVVIIAAFVAVFSFSAVQTPPAAQSALTGEQKAVETYVLDAVGRASSVALDTLYEQGGYAYPEKEKDVRFVQYRGSMVPYWRVCKSTYIRSAKDMEKDLNAKIAEILNATLPEKTDIAGRSVEFALTSMAVDTTIYESKVKVTVSMPTTIDNEKRVQPYSTEIASRLGRIRDFAEDMSWTQAKYGMLEKNLMDMIYLSDPSEEDTWVPASGIYTGSGIVKIPWSDLKKRMRALITHTLVHTRVWERPPLVDGQLTEFALDHVYIPQIENKQEPGGDWVQYLDLDVQLRYGSDESDLSKVSKEFRLSSSVDPIVIKSTGGGPFALPADYNIKYDISFPVAVSVYDNITGKSFVFMNFVNIRPLDGDRNGAAPCDVEDLDEVVPDPYAEDCENNANTGVGLYVHKYGNAPLRGVSMAFGGCDYVYTSDGSGRISGFRIPTKANAALELYDPSSRSAYTICGLSSSDLSSRDVEMPVREPFTVKFYAVNITKRDGKLRIGSINLVSHSTQERIDLTMTRKASGSCATDSVYTISNYVYQMPDGEGVLDDVGGDTPGEQLDNLDDIVNNPPSGDEVEPAVIIYGKMTEDSNGQGISFEVSDNYDVSIATRDRGKVTKSGLRLLGGVYQKESDRNIIYVYAPKIVVGTYAEGDEAAIGRLYTTCVLPPVSNLDRASYTATAVGCEVSI